MKQKRGGSFFLFFLSVWVLAVAIPSFVHAAPTLSSTANTVVDALSFDDNIVAEATDGNTLYLGGNFTSVSKNSGNAVAYDAGTDAQDTFPFFDGTVRAIIPDGLGGWFVGGSFGDVDGNTAFPYLAHVDSSGTLDENFEAGVNDSVGSLALSPDGTTLYASGDFTQVNGGEGRNFIAAFDATTGTARSFNPSLDDGSAYSMTVSSAGSTLYVGGCFTNVNNGTPHNYIAAFDTTRDAGSSK
jgi:hypothetical protein